MFTNGNYAKVWSIDKPKKGNYMEGQISTSRKDEDGDYYTDFSGFVRFIGDAAKKIKKLDEECTIKLASVGVTNKYDKKKKVEYVNYLIFDFEEPDNDEKPKKSKQKSKKKSEDDEDEEE